MKKRDGLWSLIAKLEEESGGVLPIDNTDPETCQSEQDGDYEDIADGILRRNPSLTREHVEEYLNEV